MSLKKIAEMVGVSPSTVSRVLNNTVPNCASSELKEKIWEAAHALEYVPNADARNLKTGKSNSAKSYKIAVILTRFDFLDKDPFFRELFQSVEASLLANSCILQSVTNADKADFASLEKIDGIIVLGRCSEDFLARLKRCSRNIVGVDRNPTDYKMDEVICNGKTAAIKAMEYLLALGHQKIGYIGDCSFESRYVGYCEMLIKQNIPINYQYIYSTDQTYESGYHAMEELLSRDMTAVLCANDISALGALQAQSDAVSRGKAKRKDISVISIDNIAGAMTSTPLLTTVDIPKEEMGRMAVTILLDRITHRHSEYLRVEFPCKVIERESCYRL
ncbi:MAG: LacI family transcriptional regulator [Bacteroidales bacterium]|nr:LacI family transcriptional regulator [Bacteroidales bacterium]MCM1414513.1 LacI family transcriptional regulator [bacterium]MCM1422564.1 LacI family transcriptional regulator [bacterium]